MLLTGCVYDKYSPDFCPQEGKSYYLSFVLQSPGEAANTKATDGEEIISGDKWSEQLVSKVDLYFYDGYGRFLGKESPAAFNQTPTESPANDPITNQVGDFTVELNYRPYRLLVALNMDADFSNKTIDEARSMMQSKETRWCGAATTVMGKTVTPFYMTSATYLNAGGMEVCDVDIPAASVWDTEIKASNNPMSLYIDRLASRVSVRSTKTEFRVPLVTPQDNVRAKVTLLGWGLNARNRSSYYFKKVNPAWTYKWSDTDWNNPAKFRSHWAQDANYTASENTGLELAQQKISPLDADAFAYVMPGSLTKDFTDDMDYCLENTADEGVLPVTDSDAATLYSRVTHVLVKAKLSFELASGTDDAGYTTESDFFRYKGVFYTKKSLLDALRADAGLTVVDNDDLELVSAAGQSYCKGYEKGERVAVRQISTDTILDLQESGAPVRIEGFKDGVFYYKIPIEHINNADVTGTEYPIGRYGVVRNHTYEISLNSEVNGIGTGIWDDEYDIRPFRRAEDYLLSAYVKVSPWKQFETRFYFVDPSGMVVTAGQRVEHWEGDENNGEYE